MRRSTALISQLRAQPRVGSSLHFDNCTGGFFSNNLKYTLCVKGSTETHKVVANPNLFPLGDLENMTGWASNEFDYSEQVLSMLAPSTTYTLSFEAECVGRPDPTTQCDGYYYYDYETGEKKEGSCGEIPLAFNHGGLGFALVHQYAEDWSGYGIDVPDNETFPTIPMFVYHELKEGEKYRGVVTFTTPGDFGGYYLSILTNQFYYSHDHIERVYPEVCYSTVTFRNVKIEEGTVATGYYGWYGQENIPEETKYVEAGTTIVCGDDRLTVPCNLCEGDIWYPITGQVIKVDGSTENYEPYALLAPRGTFDITQEASGAKALLCATLLSKAVGHSNNGWSWQDIQGIVRCGLASKCFRIGDQLTVNRNGIPLVFDIIGIDHDTPTDKHYKHSLTLQMHTLFDTKTAFDTRKALYYAEVGLSAGTFNFTIPSYYETTAGYGGKTYCFTLTKAVPAGGVLELVWPYGQNLTNTSKCWIKSFESQMATSPIETKVYMTEGSSGNALGVADGNDSLGRLNRIEHARYGHNVWERSTVRQYLNCDTSKEAKWIPYDQFDRPAPWASSSVGGFLYGFEEDFLSVLGEVDKVTAQLKIYGGGTKTTSDRFFLPSAQEVYCGTINRTPEGTAYAYWANNSSLSAPGTKADKSRIKYTNGTAGKWFLRTPHTDSVINEKYFDTTGKMADTSANTEIYIAPVCCIV